MELLLLFTVVPAYMVAAFFIKHDPGPEEPRPAITASVWFGVLAIVLALVFSFIIDLVLNGDSFDRVTGLEGNTEVPLFIDTFIFATLEEVVKFLPIAIFLLKRDFFNEITDGIIYFAIVGLTFGAIESILYSIFSTIPGFAVAFTRLGLALFFHGALTSIVGYFFARTKMAGGKVTYVFISLLGVSILHTMYNMFVYSADNVPAFIFGAAACALIANAAMFWLYYVASQQDIALGLAGPQFAVAREQRRQALQAQAQQAYIANQAARSNEMTPPAPPQAPNPTHGPPPPKDPPQSNV